MNATYILFNTSKLTICTLLAMIVTILLFLLMRSLIAMEPLVAPVHSYTPIDIVVPKDRVIDVNKKAEVERPADPEPFPDTPPIERSFDDVDPMVVAMTPPSTGPVLDIGLPDSGAALAIFRVAPEYPDRALRRGIEGFVDLMFDISASGKTQNIKVIYAQPTGYFENASMRTLAKWKYQPAMEDGVPQVQKNQTTRIVFELER